MRVAFDCTRAKTKRTRVDSDDTRSVFARVRSRVCCTRANVAQTHRPAPALLLLAVRRDKRRRERLRRAGLRGAVIEHSGSNEILPGQAVRDFTSEIQEQNRSIAEDSEAITHCF